MPNQSILGRRPLLAAAAAAGAAMLATNPAPAAAGSRRGALAALVGDPAASAPLVRAYLGLVPDAPDRLRALAGRLAASGVGDAGKLEAWLAAARRDDFAAGDVLVLEGWVLARSEAELLALAALA